LFSLGSFLQIAKEAQTPFSRSYAGTYDQKWFGLHFGGFFSKTHTVTLLGVLPV
jgi:hypothetical protein